MRFLIVGLGSIGERYVRNLQALGYTDIGVVRRAPRTPRTVDERSFRTYLDLGDGLASKPDAVIIANPTALHVPVAIQAVRAGTHVLIEIPLASSLEGVAELDEDAKRAGSVILMGHNLRFHPCLLKMKEIIEGGHLGRPVFARAEFGEYLPDCHPWEDYRTGYAARRDLGGGVLLTSIHEIDFLYWILGSVSEIAAMLGYDGGLDIDVEDTAALLMRHSMGTISEVHLDFIQPTYSRGCKIVCQQGAVEWLFKENRVQVSDRHSKDWQTVLDQSTFDFNQTYIDQLKHFIRCVEGVDSPVNDIRQGIEVLRIGLAALRSSLTRSFVSVCPDIYENA